MLLGYWSMTEAIINTRKIRRTFVGTTFETERSTTTLRRD